MTAQRTRVVLIHAVQIAVDPISEAFALGRPEAETVNLLDDSLSRDLARDGKITSSMRNRMSDLMQYGIKIGARRVLFTCSAFGDAVECPVLTSPDSAVSKMKDLIGETSESLP